jgi:hypothetical protein
MYVGFVSSIILNIENSCSDILHEINGNFKAAYITRHTQINITRTKDYRCFDFVMLVNKNINCQTVLHVKLSQCT